MSKNTVGSLDKLELDIKTDEDEPVVLLPWERQLTGLFDDRSKPYPTSTLHVFHVEATWKRSFPCRFNVEYKWCVCRDITTNQLKIYVDFIF